MKPDDTLPLTEKDQEEILTRIRTDNLWWNTLFKSIFSLGAVLFSATFLYFASLQHLQPWTLVTHEDLSALTTAAHTALFDSLSSLSFLLCAPAIVTGSARLIVLALVVSLPSNLFWTVVLSRVHSGFPWSLFWLPWGAGIYALCCGYAMYEMEATTAKLTALKDSMYRNKQTI